MANESQWMKLFDKHCIKEKRAFSTSLFIVFITLAYIHKIQNNCKSLWKYLSIYGSCICKKKKGGKSNNATITKQKAIETPKGENKKNNTNTKD